LFQEPGRMVIMNAGHVIMSASEMPERRTRVRRLKDTMMV